MYFLQSLHDADDVAMAARGWFHLEDTAGQTILTSLFGIGWEIIMISAFLINHFDLIGLRQVWFYFLGKEYVPLKFRIPFFYKYVRHPLYFGWLICFRATPVMSAAHLLFALVSTGYIFTAIWFEERDLTVQFGNDYISYKSKTPMILLLGKRKYHNLKCMKAILSKPFFRKYGKNALIIYLYWCIAKGILFLLIAQSFFDK